MCPKRIPGVTTIYIRITIDKFYMSSYELFYKVTGCGGHYTGPSLDIQVYQHQIKSVLYTLSGNLNLG